MKRRNLLPCLGLLGLITALSLAVPSFARDNNPAPQQSPLDKLKRCEKVSTGFIECEKAGEGTTNPNGGVWTQPNVVVTSPINPNGTAPTNPNGGVWTQPNLVVTPYPQLDSSSQF